MYILSASRNLVYKSLEGYFPWYRMCVCTPEVYDAASGVAVRMSYVPLV